MKKRLVMLCLVGLMSFTGLLSACAPAIPHPIAGWSDCISCHSPNGVKPYPQWHADRTSEVRGNDSCTNCHKFARGNS